MSPAEKYSINVFFLHPATIKRSGLSTNYSDEFSRRDFYSTEMFEITKDGAFSSSLKVLIFFFEYPKKFEKSYMIGFYLVSYMIRTMTLVWFSLASLIHLIVVKIKKIDLDVSENLTVIMSGLVVAVICGLFVRSSKDWSWLLINITDFKRFGRPPKTDDFIQKSNRLSKIMTAYCAMGTTLYALIACYDSLACERRNIEKNLHEYCFTMTPLWLPFENSTRVGRIILLIVQYLSSIAGVVPGGVQCYLVWETSRFIRLHIDYLKLKLELAINSETQELRKKYMRNCIQYHIHILRTTAHFNVVSKRSMGPVSLISALVFGCMANQLDRIKPLATVVNLVGWMVCCFLLCDAGQMVIDETESVALAVYDTKWYDVEVDIMKDVFFLLMRSQKPVTLEALPLGNLNYPLYLMALKTSYTYVTLLRNAT